MQVLVLFLCVTVGITASAFAWVKVAEIFGPVAGIVVFGMGLGLSLVLSVALFGERTNSGIDE